MAPILLKVKALSNNFQPFADLTNAEELERTWKICTKAKDALENGNRLENLSWRLWYRHQTLSKTHPNKFSKLSQKTTNKLQNDKILEYQQSQKAVELKRQLRLPEDKKRKTENIVLNKQIIPAAVVETKGTKLISLVEPPPPIVIDPIVEHSPLIVSDFQQNSSRSTTPLNNPYFTHSYPVATSQGFDGLYEFPQHSPPAQFNPFTFNGQGMNVPSFLTAFQWPADSFLIPDLYSPNPYQQQMAQPYDYQQHLPLSHHQPLPQQQPVHQHSVNCAHHHHQQQQPSQQQQQQHLPDQTAMQRIPVIRDNCDAVDSSLIPNAKCNNCGVTQTPLWRKSNDDEILCNACGLYLKLHNIHRPKPKVSPVIHDNGVAAVCFNCETKNTPLWRRDAEGNVMCNACGLYYKLHQVMRPLSLKTDTIRKRQRYATDEDGVPKKKKGAKN